ncbi:MAG: HAMP domain-containing histidine kinase [Solirubrobacteraceae bacterium]|nr:HAMP domain-containing histidine kinase [Solirubrobacteraceae bacterium]
MTGPAAPTPKGRDDAERARIVGEAMDDAFAVPAKGRGRGRLVRAIERLPITRWFKGSLPGRISAVFLLAAIVTVTGLLYATPRLENALIAPRERSVEATARTGVAVIRAAEVQAQQQGQILTSADVPNVVSYWFGVGGRLQRSGLVAGNERVAVFGVTGNPKAPTITNLDPTSSQRASRLVRRVALPPDREQTDITRVDEQSRIEAAQSFTINTGERIVFSAWQPIDDIERTVQSARSRILVAGIGGASVALLLGVWVTTRLTRRIRTLEAGARKVAQGDFTAQFPGEGSLELSSLARALNEMQRQLAELETARRRFIATASHELRTPLATLQGFLELLEDDNLEPQRRHEFVMHASEQAQRLSKLAGDLLDLSRLDVGSVKVRRAPTDVGLLLEGLLAEFRVAGAQHGSMMERRVDPRAETAVIDGDRVLQLLRALVDNALTHTPQGTAITVAARRTGARVEFTVSDDGPGIPLAHQREMFEAFVTSDETRGSGLGLAISRELARRMQGDLTVTSAPGSTVFTLSLPA